MESLRHRDPDKLNLMNRILLRAPRDPFTPISPELGLALYDRGFWGRNAGNLVFTDAMHKLLSTPDAQITPNSFLSERPGINQGYIDRINEQFDVFVVPLANAFRKKFVGNLKRLTQVIEGLKIPVVVVGVGVEGGVRSLDDPFPSPEGELREAVIAFVRAVLERSASIGVRGEFTQAYLAELGFGDEVIDVVGCPSLFRYGPDLKIEKRSPGLTADSRFTINITPYVPYMGRASVRHAQKYPNLIYVPQGDDSLELMMWGLEPETIKNRDLPVHRDHPLYAENRMRFFVDTVTWMDFLREQEFSFGSRIHGNIAALSAGTPAYVLAHDSRTLELARYHEIPHTRVPDLPKDVDAADLYAEADYGAFNSGHAARWGVFADFLKRNDIEHIFLPGKENLDYEQRLREVPMPAAVQTLNATDPNERRRIAERTALVYRHGGLKGLKRDFKPDIPFPLTLPGALVRRPNSVRAVLGRVRRRLRRR